MPRHCCVPGCKINYCSEVKSTSYRSVFRFPKNEELKSKWLAAHVVPEKYNRKFLNLRDGEAKNDAFQQLFKY
nr:unnamed protein product [Callosobruchus analis]